MDRAHHGQRNLAIQEGLLGKRKKGEGIGGRYIGKEREGRGGRRGLYLGHKFWLSVVVLGGGSQ